MASIIQIDLCVAYTWERPTRCTLFLINLFHFIYPRHHKI